MNKIQFRAETDGFYGVYWKNKNPNDHAIIAMLGDDSQDRMAKKAAEWLQEKGVNVLTLSIGKKDYSYHNYPLERMENAIRWLEKEGNRKIGIIGASTTATLSLVTASFFPDISLTLAFSPSDFIFQGFAQGRKDGCEEWPIENESLFTYRGNPLPYLPFVYSHPEYWKRIQKEKKETGNLLASRSIFDDSEKAHPIREEEYIKTENIHGELFLIGSEDDSMWDTAKYIRRMQERISKKNPSPNVTCLIYPHGTHFLFPQSLLHRIFPVGSSLILKILFRDARKYAKECQATRIDLDKRIDEAIKMWKIG